MGEGNILTIAQKFKSGGTVRDLRSLRGVAYALGAKEAGSWRTGDASRLGALPTAPHQPPTAPQQLPTVPHQLHTTPHQLPTALAGGVHLLPSFEEVRDDKFAFAEATRIIHTNTNPFNAQTLVQFHDRQAVVQTPPAFPLSQAEMDDVYDLPYTRRPHPRYTEPIPAHEMIKDSVTILRGCFGGCTFCSITAHQGRIIQSRSSDSVLKEAEKIAADPDFKGIISDIGGATANMYTMRCSRPEVEAKCKRLSCVHPTVCKLMGTDHGPLIELMRDVRNVDGIRKVLVSSGIRMDLAQMSPEYVRELAEHHTGGRLKVAPEHTSPKVLDLMKKPSIDNFGVFADQFRDASAAAGKPKQQLVPYFIASHPGTDLSDMIDLALYLKRNGYRPDQVQDFIPAPVRHRDVHVLHRPRPVYEKAGANRQAPRRPQVAAGAHAVLQAGELLHGAGSIDSGKSCRPDRRLRRADPGPAAEGIARSAPAASQRRRERRSLSHGRQPNEG